jgi:hypothetical protein
MHETILENVQLPEALKNADEGSVTLSTILPVRMESIIGGFEESLLTALGCVEAAGTDKQDDAA